MKGTVSAVGEVVPAFGWLEALEDACDCTPQFRDGSPFSFAQQSLELGEGLLDGVEVGGLCRQIQQEGAG